MTIKSKQNKSFQLCLNAMEKHQVFAHTHNHCSRHRVMLQLTLTNTHWGVPNRHLRVGKCRINLYYSFIVQFYSTVLYDNFQICSINLWHNFMRQFYSRFFSTDPLGVAPLFSCVSDFGSGARLKG